MLLQFDAGVTFVLLKNLALWYLTDKCVGVARPRHRSLCDCLKSQAIASSQECDRTLNG
ncbi:MAG: hypothetical protein KME54_02285 [Tolypothrix brevis GSE-NOS-MK-07-07A]|nr:hypothetical protein [Tolypothrix brevis GSE-NOS-MK-07-07A]